MRTLLLFLILIPACVVAAEPVFDIPRLDGVTVNGKGEEWGGGFDVNMLVNDEAKASPPAEFDPHIRLGWDEHGLLIFASVNQRGATEGDTLAALDQKDHLEMTLADGTSGFRMFRTVVSTGLDPRYPQMRTAVTDLRVPSQSKPVVVETSVGRTPFGYTMEARLPWSDLGIEAREGTEVYFQFSASHVDSTGAKMTVSWCPGYRTGEGRPVAMYRLRLASRPSDPVLAATRVMLDGGRPRLEIVGASALVGGTAAAEVFGRTLSTGVFEMDGGRGRAVLFLPRTGAAVHWVGGHCDVDSSDIDPLIAQAVNLVQMAFHPSVFSGTSFPRCGFDPSPASAALGDCEMTTTFYDRDYNLVTSADRPGRYGAIVEVRTPAGTVFKRFLTLYRTPEPVTWRVTHGYAAPQTFPPELGIDPRVVSDREREVAAFETAELAAGIDHSNDAAILLAGLSEMKPGGAQPRTRNAPRALDQQWWFGLKKKTQDLGIDYSAHLPSNYGSSATRNWPLILFLHGSGERGYDIQAVKNNSLPRRVAAQPDFPAILIAPQCPPGQVWSPFELNALLDRLEKTYRVDPARVYLTGLSMGGFGTWALAAESPQRFAAIVPICGGGDPWDADRIKNIPCWIFHGGKDPAVPLQFSQDMADALKRAGAKNLKFTIYPEAGHDSWTQAYAEPGLFDWMLKQHLPEK